MSCNISNRRLYLMSKTTKGNRFIETMVPTINTFVLINLTQHGIRENNMYFIIRRFPHKHKKLNKSSVSGRYFDIGPQLVPYFKETLIHEKRVDDKDFLISISINSLYIFHE